MFETLREQDAEGSIRIVEVDVIRDADRHFIAVSRSNSLQCLRFVERAGAHFTNRKLYGRTDRFEINDAEGLVRPFVVFESALKPEAMIATTDRWARFMNATPPFTLLVRAVVSGGFPQFVHAQDCAAKGTRPAAALSGATRALGILGELSQVWPQASIELPPPVVHIDAVSLMLGRSLRDSICSQIRS